MTEFLHLFEVILVFYHRLKSLSLSEQTDDSVNQHDGKYHVLAHHSSDDQERAYSLPVVWHSVFHRELMKHA